MFFKKKLFAILLIVSVLVSSILSACAPATKQAVILPNTLMPTEIQHPTATMEMTETIEPSPTVTIVLSTETPEQISYVTDATLQAQRVGAFEATKTLISSLPNASRNEIVEMLLRKWLDYYKSDKVDSSVRLKGYIIEKIDATSGYCPPPDKNTRKFAAEVQFSVQPINPRPSDWLVFPGNIIWGEKNWIYHLDPYVSILEGNGVYIFGMEGSMSMPCG